MDIVIDETKLSRDYALMSPAELGEIRSAFGKVIDQFRFIGTLQGATTSGLRAAADLAENDVATYRLLKEQLRKRSVN